MTPEQLSAAADAAQEYYRVNNRGIGVSAQTVAQMSLVLAKVLRAAADATTDFQKAAVEVLSPVVEGPAFRRGDEVKIRWLGLGNSELPHSTVLAVEEDDLLVEWSHSGTTWTGKVRQSSATLVNRPLRCRDVVSVVGRTSRCVLSAVDGDQCWFGRGDSRWHAPIKNCTAVEWGTDLQFTGMVQHLASEDGFMADLVMRLYPDELVPDGEAAS